MEHGVIIPFAMFAFVGVMGRLLFAMIGSAAARRGARATPSTALHRLRHR